MRHWESWRLRCFVCFSWCQSNDRRKMLWVCLSRVPFWKCIVVTSCFKKLKLLLLMSWAILIMLLWALACLFCFVLFLVSHPHFLNSIVNNLWPFSIHFHNLVKTKEMAVVLILELSDYFQGFILKIFSSWPPILIVYIIKEWYDRNPFVWRISGSLIDICGSRQEHRNSLLAMLL